jgi:hypothetical protein
MDALDKEIQAKRVTLAKLDSERERVVIELKALERAASLRPIYGAADIQENGDNTAINIQTRRRGGGGKPPGAISPAWRGVLEEMYAGGPYKYHEFLAVAQMRGITTNATAVRDRVRALAIMGFLAGNPSEGFIVTKEAAMRFGFTEKDEAPTAKAVEPHEIRHQADQTGAG